MQISVVIITRNEEENLRKSLPKLQWCQDIVVIDDNSSDHTVSVAESFGCQVYNRTFDGFGTQKQFAVSKTRFQWVLNIDADEILSDELIEEMRQIDLEHTEFSGFKLPIRHVFMGKVFKYGKEGRYYHLRLFNKTKGDFNASAVHEKVVVKGMVKPLSNVILHNSYRDLEHYFQKFNQYTSIGARKLKEQKKTRGLVVCILAFPMYFIKHFFFYGNILNGRAGLVWSYLTAWYHTVKYLKLYELNKSG